MTQVYLVPGFFGFTALGAYNYFHRVAETLKHALEKHEINAQIIEVDTIPTGSIKRRAIRLLETVKENDGLKQKHLHFIGHSTGGLDIRMLLTRGIKLLPGREEAEIGKRTRSAITISTPHYGTPMANFFTSMNGRNLLYLLALMATSGPGRYTIYAIARLLRQFSSIDRFIGQKDNVLDSMAENLFSKIQTDEGDAIWEYLRKISRDQGAMVQLSPEGMDLFNASVTDKPGIDYTSFISASPSPNPNYFIPHVKDLYRAFTHGIYAMCYEITKREHRHYPYPVPDGKILNRIKKSLPFKVDGTTNDGIVPSLSQFWGELGGVMMADHMDVVGQFQHIYNGKEYSSWLCSGSGFTEERFQSLWTEIAGVIYRAQSKPHRKQKPADCE
jgi:triacylglycerol lipase